ncbi:hypothetical protein BD779DRAFT_1528087 [Infundibulicybe gibba]|nr:hypothetical protein BD779DRAFT_1528087 [Infundibulicybe gibba]
MKASSSRTLSVAPSTAEVKQESGLHDDHTSSLSSIGSPMYSSLLLSSSWPANDDYDVKQSELTLSPDFRNSRPSTVPSTNINTCPSPEVAISASNFQNFNNINHQDVYRSFVNNSAPHPTTPEYHSNGYPNFSASSTSNHVVNQPTNRLRTFNRVFSTTKDLAAHHGIPQILPPAPRITPRQAQPQSPTDFSSTCSNYLNMLSQTPTDNTMAAEDTNPAATVAPADLQSPSQIDSEDTTDLQGIIDVIIGETSHMPSWLLETHTLGSESTASPEFQSMQYNQEMDDFLTSPLMSTPFADFDTSPLDDSPDTDYLTTPIMADWDAMTSPMVSNDLPLFGGLPEIYSPSKPVIPVPPARAPNVDMDNMYTISPATPALDFVDPSSLYPSPRLPVDRSSFPPSSTRAPSRRKSSATGTRKNITPDALVPLDAPTQPRKYLTPSATSRKEVPSAIAKKRARSQAFGDEEDELFEEPLAPNATEKEQIEWKRRQNTLAARKSRKRKLQYQQDLEENLQHERRERQKWETRAVMLRELCRSHHIPFQDFED